ncbi:cytochrome P450 6AQ8 [Nasonia vitripennis]|uniref:Cytochrome P450 n=1 Tax=Nasonia vitripennis TaxID=7425 RepID=A0A7M6UGE1_NASVI|nr:cytochrome P450 6AQ8 [Nasonia vitripennis]
MALLTHHWGLDGLILLSSLLVGIYLYFTRNFKYWQKRGIKQVPPTALFGNIGAPLLGQKPFIKLLSDMYKAGEDEPYIGYYVLDKPFLLLRDPELIKYVLIKDFNNFPNRVAASRKTDVVGSMNLFVVNNPEWKYIRQKLSPIFTSGRLKKMFDLILEVDKDLDVHMNSLKLEGSGRDIEVKDICSKFTTDIIGLTAYGMKFNSLTDPDAMIRKVGKDIFGRSYRRYLEFFAVLQVPTLVNVFGFEVFGKAATKFLRYIFWNAINERIQSGAKRADLIDLLVGLKKEQESDSNQNSFKLEGDTLVAQAAVFFTGGFETSSSTMSFGLYELAKNPTIQDKLRKEIRDTLDANNKKVTYDMIMSSLPYLDMVISEVLRMYPILPYLDRNTEADYQLPGTKLVLKAGTPVVIPMQAMHMDSRYFPKPEIFDPERFSPENKKNILPNTYFPFGDGPRICIGMRLGLMQTKLGLIHLISKYEFSPCKDTLIPMEFDKYSVFTTSRNDIILNVRKLRD